MNGDRRGEEIEDGREDDWGGRERKGGMIERKIDWDGRKEKKKIEE